MLFVPDVAFDDYLIHLGNCLWLSLNGICPLLEACDVMSDRVPDSVNSGLGFGMKVGVSESLTM
jgi:hypothetical protein